MVGNFKIIFKQNTSTSYISDYYWYENPKIQYNDIVLKFPIHFEKVQLNSKVSECIINPCMKVFTW